jgi:hypothetical protein
MSQPGERHLTAIEKVWRVGYGQEMSCSGDKMSLLVFEIYKRGLCFLFFFL